MIHISLISRFNVVLIIHVYYTLLINYGYLCSVLLVTAHKKKTQLPLSNVINTHVELCDLFTHSNIYLYINNYNIIRIIIHPDTRIYML